ncbi:MAG: acyl-CoA dehydrogenase family protein, partial [Proteobacteria bacterium]|nr:acyl-CoA dehydrogenase family protein [Pseudomonadota bacterium]
GIEVPEPQGGAGATFFMSILAIEELARVDASVAVVCDVQNTLVINAVKKFGSAEQQQRLLAKLAGGSVGAYALSEAGAGSDAFALACRAESRGKDFAVTGRKLWITNGGEAELFLVFATVDASAGYKGITCFVIERGMAGFSVPRKEDKLGIRASSTCELVFDAVVVPPANVLGAVGKGYKVAIETLNEGRIGIAAQMVGLAAGAFEGAFAYVQHREQFGKKIVEFQAVRHRLARCATDIEAARLLTYNAARLHDAGQPFLREAAMAKWFASEVAERVASECLELYGGVGFTKDCPAEKYLRDAKIGKIYEGTSFVQLDTIAKLLF